MVPKLFTFNLLGRLILKTLTLAIDFEWFVVRFLIFCMKKKFSTKGLIFYKSITLLVPKFLTLLP
jgi:hypothetical protein